MGSPCSTSISARVAGAVHRQDFVAILLCALALLVLAPAALAHGTGLAGTGRVGSAAAESHTKAGGKPSPVQTAVAVAVDRTRPGPAVPPDFLGLSFEMSSLPQMAQYANRGDLVTLLRSLGPGVLRFGGVSADTRIAWTDARTPRPAWASGVVDADDFRQLAALAAQSGWRIVLTVGIVHFEPAAAAREVAAARAALGESLEAIELGNEPNAYALHSMREEPWGVEQYDAQVAEYRAAIEAVVPGIPLWGPDVSGSSAFATWGPGEVVDQRPAMLTGHHYPLGCEQKPPPSIQRLLSAPIRTKEIASLRRYVKIARAGNLPFRLDETNSVSCGGVADISDTFASALWAAGFLPQVMASGAAGVNLHGNVSRCTGYSPICAAGPEELATGELIAQPVWYVLLMMKGLVGDRPLPTTVVRSPRSANVQVTALVAADGRLDFVVADDEPLGKQGAIVRLRVGPGYVGASTLALTGGSLAALTGTALGGAEVGPDGSWRASERGRVHARDGVLAVNVPAASAVLLSASPAG
jgi:hypothetical protein